MKKFLSLIVVVSAILVASSCGSGKKLAYFTNADSISLAASAGLYDAKIMPKDLLTITVNTTDPKAATPFNLSTSVSSGSSTSTAGAGSYLVDNDGYINFPVVGKLYVNGMTKRECEDYVRDNILPYMASDQNPIVTVRMASFKVSVLGEVKSPGIFVVDQEKISILEALARAGDLTIYGKRDNVMLIREDATGQKSVHRMNLNDANLMNSPLYYLQQNDVIYVSPNKVRAISSANAGLWLSMVSTVASAATVIVTVVNVAGQK